jgi:putative chitinase
MIAADRDQFFQSARDLLFRGSITQSQVDGINAIFSAWDELLPSADPRFVAYGFATVYHETACTMQPIPEDGKGRGRPYGLPAGPYHQIYYGRGLVQLTWLANYQTAEKWIPGSDLVQAPDNALKPDIAAKVMIRGMTQGWFTGRKLSDYFDGVRSDWTDARRIINGVDKAALIAGYALHFLHAIEG